MVMLPDVAHRLPRQICDRLAKKLQAQSSTAKRQRAWALLQPSTQALQLDIRVARDTAELRAAAYLRAASFYTYPSDRSPFAQQSHQRMKADAEWKALEDKVEGRDEQYKNVRVTCFIATVPDDGGDAVATAAADAAGARSGKLPAAGGLGPQVVVGTLDINQGASLPSEELAGGQPSGPLASVARAYLSNVCVASPARRQGVASALIREALAHAAGQGVTHVYVHVAADNAAAAALYAEGCGFVVEAEESEGSARALKRPRRLLLRRDLAPNSYALHVGAMAA